MWADVGKHSSAAESGEKREEPVWSEGCGWSGDRHSYGAMEWKRVSRGSMEVEIAKADDSLPSFECDCEEKVEKGMATHSSILAWRIPWTEEPGGLQSTGSRRVGHDWATNMQGEKEYQGQYQKETMLKEQEKLDHGAVLLAQPCSKKSPDTAKHRHSGPVHRIWSQVSRAQNKTLALPLACSLSFPTFGVEQWWSKTLPTSVQFSRSVMSNSLWPHEP